jgi:hypothetical protein
MKNKIVTLKSFLGTTEAKKFTEERENYWKLIGKKGKVIDVHQENDKVLVHFEINLDDMNLENHNTIKNSLWIKKSDLTLENS